MQVTEFAEEIASLEQHLAQAQQAGNRPALHHLIAADYDGINARGQRVDRETFIAAFLAPELMIESLHLHDLSVRAFEHTAIATGHSAVSGYLRGKPFLGRYNFTDVWVRRLMHWEIVAGHVSHAA